LSLIKGQHDGECQVAGLWGSLKSGSCEAISQTMHRNKRKVREVLKAMGDSNYWEGQLSKPIQTAAWQHIRRDSLSGCHANSGRKEPPFEAQFDHSIEQSKN
jgi:hypothetical protein